MSSDTDLDTIGGLGDNPEKIELELKYAFSNSILRDVNVKDQMKSDLINYNNIERSKENITNLM